MITLTLLNAPPVAAPSPEVVARSSRQEDRPLAARTATVAPRAAGRVTAPLISRWFRRSGNLAMRDGQLFARTEIDGDGEWSEIDEWDVPAEDRAMVEAWQADWRDA